MKFKKFKLFKDVKKNSSLSLHSIALVNPNPEMPSENFSNYAIMIIHNKNFLFYDISSTASDFKILRLYAYSITKDRLSIYSLIDKYKNDIYIIYNDYVYCGKNNNNYSDEQIELLFKKFIYEENTKFKVLKKEIELYEKVDLSSNEKIKRVSISEEVKFEVWRRDEGKCVNCGSKQNLEFDHIIPFSKGGSNTTRNLQLLCESCNRKKSAKI